MQESGHGNDWVMVLVPVGVAIVVSTMFGGPAETLNAVDILVRDIMRLGLGVVNRLL